MWTMGIKYKKIRTGIDHADLFGSKLYHFYNLFGKHLHYFRLTLP
ncbi:hypothetical protein A33Q_2573 [Indibacter alkaliphilus LW1]|uniref:Uncharacterized protein n=1 Tax=Indibacter alkaliphilus (strain CCUG 57479 / KCTC 22604 / LW1) TaxID=1189612 RepID=S2DFZ4_INDAL|nr:hypothetical protein A33Q_2573 [Indibacter alkaliphilus LW1]